MRYHVAPIFCRPWLLAGLSQRLIESHYANNYGGALRRLNAITEKLATLDSSATPGYAVKGLKSHALVAPNSTPLADRHVSTARPAGHPTSAIAVALTRDFATSDRWR